MPARSSRPPRRQPGRPRRAGSRPSGPSGNLDRTSAPQLWCILDEGVLHRAIGGSKVMRSQLYRLAEVAEHPKTTIQVIRSGGAHAGLLGGFILADLDSKPPVAYLETAAEGRSLTAPQRSVMSLFVSIDSGHRPSRGSRPAT